MSKSVEAAGSLLVVASGLLLFKVSEWVFQAEQATQVAYVSSAKRYEGWPMATAIVVIGVLLFSRAVNRKD